MKFNDLFENDTPPAEEIAARIKKDCQPFLNQSNGRLIYRGTRSTKDDFFVGKRIKNRPPVDSPPVIHNMVNKILDDMGFKANRSNSIFVTGNQEDAGYYGQIYVIFPIGDFYFTWSTVVKDLYWALKDDWQDFNPTSMRQFIEDSYQHDDDLMTAIKSGNEIMINVDKYYAIDKRFYLNNIEDLI